MADLQDIDDVQEELLKDKPLLILRDGDAVEFSPLTPVRKETSRFNVGIEQYRVVVYIDKSKSIRQFILSKQRFMRLKNLVGTWTRPENACKVRVTRNGTGIQSEYKFELVNIGSMIAGDILAGLTLLVDMKGTDDWEDFVQYAEKVLSETLPNKETEKETEKDTEEKPKKK